MRQAPPTTVEFEELLVAHQRPILHYIKSLVADHHEAEDLLQKTNLILWQKRARFVAGSNFRAWSLTIARLEALSHLRRQRRDQRVFSGPSFPEVAKDELRTFEDGNADTLVALKNCLKRLPARDQELLLMRYGSNRTLGEYAKNLNRSPGTLKARLFKIRENLRKSIEAHLKKSDPPIATNWPDLGIGFGGGAGPEATVSERTSLIRQTLLAAGGPSGTRGSRVPATRNP